MTTRALTMLNESGDTTIVWSADRDDEMEEIITRKMAAGCVFYIIDPRFGMREPLREARDANRHRMLAIPDADFTKFVGETPSDTAPTAAVVPTPTAPVKTVRRGRKPREIAQSESIGVAPRRGG